MDPNTGRIYDEQEMQDLPPEIKERLIFGKREELEELQKHIIQKEVEELGEILDEMEKIKELPDPKPERFYPINRASRRAAEKRERKQKFVNKPGKVRNHG